MQTDESQPKINFIRILLKKPLPLDFTWILKLIKKLVQKILLLKNTIKTNWRRPLYKQSEEKFVFFVI